LKILENILDARELFGTDVARCAARRADKKDIEQMKILMEKLIQTTDPGNYSSWISNFPSNSLWPAKTWFTFS